MLWFKSKNKDKVTEVTCPPSDVCKVMDCRLNDLRNNQSTQRKIKERIKDLENQYFPMVYWWIVTCSKIGNHIFLLDHGKVCRGDIERTLQKTICELKADSYFFSRGLNVNQFDVDQFCKEMRDIFTTDQQLKELNHELNELVKSEKNLKKVLGIS